MTNPGNMVRVRARRGGRASVYEANAIAQAFSAGILAGNGARQNTVADMNVLVGGTPTNPTVVLASSPTGYRVAIDLVATQAVQLTKPAANSRVSAIVAYTNDLAEATEENGMTGSPSSCGLIVVNGAAASSPSVPTDSEIRLAISADGGTGAQACYVVLATITVSSTATSVTTAMISNRASTLVGARIAAGSIGASQLANNAVTNAKIANNTIEANKMANGTGNGTVAPTNKNVLRLGGRKIMWGGDTVRGVPSGTDKALKVTFPEGFATVPRVYVCVNGWYGEVFIQVANDAGAAVTTTTEFAVVVRHNFGSNLDINFNYVAIG